MSYKRLSIERSEALNLIRRQIEKGEDLLRKNPSTAGEECRVAVSPQTGNIFALAFRQWDDRTCSILYKIFEDSTHASGFEETDSGAQEPADPTRTNDREYSLKKQMKQKLDYLKSVLNSIDDLEEVMKTPPETHNVTMSGNADEPSANSGRNISAVSMELTTNPKKVFIVHGRHSRINDDFFSLLQALHLEPVGWSEAGVFAGGKGGPYFGEILSSTFSQAQAVIILLTPDDLVISKKPSHCEKGEGDEKTPFGQPGADVLFQAGLFFGQNPQRTVIIEIEQLTPFSKIYEGQALRLDNSFIQRQKIANRLRTAGCNVNTDGSDWLSVGNFQVLPAEEESTASQNEEVQDSSPSNTAMDIPDLSGEALQLLIEAAQDQSCTLSIISSMGGLGIVTNGKIFGIGSNKISWDTWHTAFHELLEHRLIQDADCQEERFLITHEGYRVADLLSGKMDGN